MKPGLDAQLPELVLDNMAAAVQGGRPCASCLDDVTEA